MAEQRDRTRLDVALEEKVGGASINVGTQQSPGDNDILDSVPTFADLSGSTMIFPGVAIAIDDNNAGIVIAKSIGFYRVDENEDHRDWNGDGDDDDFVLFRTSITQGTSFATGTINSISGRPALDLNVEESSPTAAAFLTEEANVGATGTDVNHDGDTFDFVVQYFTF
jgi:hypothetical protein